MLKSDLTYWQWCYSSVVWLSRSCIVSKRLKISTHFFAYDCIALSDQTKIRLTSVNPSSPNIDPKWPPPVDLSFGDIRSQIVAEWLQIAQWSHRKLPLLFLMVPSLTPTTSPFPKLGVPNPPCRTNFVMHAATWRIRQKILTWQTVVCCALLVCHYERAMLPLCVVSSTHDRHLASSKCLLNWNNRDSRYVSVNQIKLFLVLYMVVAVANVPM